MTVSIEITFRSRLKNAVRPDVLEQLITHYTGVPEAEAIVRAGSQLSDDKLFLGFVSGVPSLRAVYGVLNDGVLDDVVSVSQRLVGVSPKVAFGFLRSGKTIVDGTPDYAKMLVLGMAASMSNPLALVSFIENSGRIAVDAGNELIFRKWFDDGISLSGADQVAHFGYDTVSRAVLDYFKIGGRIFPVSCVVRPYADCAVGALGALRDAENIMGKNGELGEFVDYLRSPAGKVLLLRFYEDELNAALRDVLPPKDVLRAGFVQQKTNDLLERIGISEERIIELRSDNAELPRTEFTLQDEYIVLTRYLTSIKELEREISEAEKERSKLVHGYALLIDDINGKKWRLAVIKKEFGQKKKVDCSDVLNRVYNAVGNFLSEDLKNELELFKDNAQDEQYVSDVISRANLDLEQKTAKLKAKYGQQDAENFERLRSLEVEHASWGRAIYLQLGLWPITQCPRMRNKDGQTWLWLPEGIIVDTDTYKMESIGKHAYITKKEWRN